MRRKDREITDFKKMIEIVDACDCARLGLVDEGMAYIVPMNFGYEVNDQQLCLYFHCAKEGKKIELIRRQNVVSFEMDTKHNIVLHDVACDSTCFYQSIMGKGTIQIVQDLDEKKHGLQKIMDQYSNTKQWEFNNHVLSNVCVLKLEVSSWTCKEH